MGKCLYQIKIFILANPHFILSMKHSEIELHKYGELNKCTKCKNLNDFCPRVMELSLVGENCSLWMDKRKYVLKFWQKFCFVSHCHCQHNAWKNSLQFADEKTELTSEGWQLFWPLPPGNLAALPRNYGKGTWKQCLHMPQLLELFLR